MNIAQTNFMRFTRVCISNKKYLMLNCVIYHLTLVFLIQAMDLFSEAHRSSCSEMFFKIVVLKIFDNFTRNICVGVFFNKVTGPQACNFLKKKLQHKCFLVKFLRFSITFFYSTFFLQQLLLKTVKNYKTKIFERRAVLQGGRDHICRDLVSQHLKN